MQSACNTKTTRSYGELENYWLGVETGFFWPEEGRLLQRNCEGKGCLEIGSFGGRSACCMAAVAKFVHCVDPFTATPDGQSQENHYTTLDAFLQAVRPFQNILYSIGMSSDVVPSFPDHFFDFCFIDANHSYENVRKDTLVAWDKVADDGFFAYHDYGGWPGGPRCTEEYVGVTQFVNEMFDHSQSQMSRATIVVPKRCGDPSRLK